VAKILFTNDRSAPTDLVIEPWGYVETVPVGVNVIFEFNDAPPPEVQFLVRDSGEAYIYLNSETVRMSMPGKECTYGNGTRAPSFPILK